MGKIEFVDAPRKKKVMEYNSTTLGKSINGIAISFLRSCEDGNAEDIDKFLSHVHAAIAEEDDKALVSQALSGIRTFLSKIGSSYKIKYVGDRKIESLVWTIRDWEKARKEQNETPHRNF